MKRKKLEPNKKSKRKTRSKRILNYTKRKIRKSRPRGKTQMKMSDHKNTCLHCTDLKCEVRATCYDDITATESRKEIIEEIPEPTN